MDLYGEDDYGADGGYGVCDHDGNVAEQDSLDDEEHRSESEHKERRHGDTVGIARAYSGYRLRQIPEYHAERGSIAGNCYNCVHKNPF